ncbi:MAG: hypothetical protein ACYTE8_09780 [Planctomycetota bacterium]
MRRIGRWWMEDGRKQRSEVRDQKKGGKDTGSATTTFGDDIPSRE